MATDRHLKSNGQGHGMNWILQYKRLAIYLRDGLCCVYCGAGPEETRLTLDHLRPHSSGGTDNFTNLVTCCLRCNSARGKRAWKLFCDKVVGYLGHEVTAAEVILHVEDCRRRKLDLDLAKQICSRQPGFRAAMSEALALKEVA